MGKCYSSPMVTMIKLSEASVIMWLLLLRFQELLLFKNWNINVIWASAFCNVWSLGKIKWDTLHVFLINRTYKYIVTNLYNWKFINLAYTVQITFIFIGQTHLVFGKRVCTCVTKHSNAFRTFLNWLKNSKRVWHEPKLHIMRVPLFANFDLWSVSVGWV